MRSNKIDFLEYIPGNRSLTKQYHFFSGRLVRYSIIATLTILTGCQTVNSLPVGGSLQLTRELRFEPGYSRSFIQYGKAVSSKQIEQREPYCLFYRYESPEEMHRVRTLNPGNFTIQSSHRELGTLPLPILNPIVFGDSLREDTLATVFKIHSPHQPEITQLRCEIFTEPLFQNHLNLQQIKQTLGDIVLVAP
jgi:hypothetical protein